MFICSSELQDVFMPFLELNVLKFGTSFKRKCQLHYKAYEMLCKSQDTILLLVLHVIHEVSN